MSNVVPDISRILPFVNSIIGKRKCRANIHYMDEKYHVAIIDKRRTIYLSSCDAGILINKLKPYM